MNNKITVEGEYIYVDETGSVTEEFNEEFILNGIVSTVGEARAIIKRLIRPRLRKKNPETKFIKTCQVIDMTPCMEKAEQVDLTKLWLEAINLSCIPDSLGEYRNEDAIMVALKTSIDKAKARRAKAAAKKASEVNHGNASL